MSTSAKSSKLALDESLKLTSVQPPTASDIDLFDALDKNKVTNKNGLTVL